MKRIIRILMVLVLAFAVIGCKDDNTGSKEVKATAITVTTPKSKSLVQVGKTLQCSYKLTPSNAVKPAEGVTWSLSDNSFGTINQEGLFTAGDKEGIVKIIVTTNDEAKLTNYKMIKVTTEVVPEYPDLGGYNIKIAQATIALGEYDVFLEQDTAAKYGYYDDLDRQAKQQAWEAVEADFNCQISVVEYPADAPWGPSRWAYIQDRARENNPQYDLYVIPESQIPGLVSANALVDLTSWYAKYGNDFMSQFSRVAGSYKGKLYSVNDCEPAIYNILGYNVGLWEKINEYDPTILEPAKMFNDNNWTYSTFIDYCKKCQDALDSLYNNNLEAKSYYSLSGWPTFYWVGMVDRNGTGVADVDAMKVHLTGDDETAAGDALKEICDYGAFDQAFSVDGSVQSWTNGTSLFNTGELWFIGSNQGRWDSDMWGEGDATRYGYVPFPAPDSSDPTRTYIGVHSEATWALAAGREKYYDGYGEECTTENIYYAIISYLQRARQIFQSEDGYDKDNILIQTAKKSFATEESQKAFVNLSKVLDTDGFYDPMCSNDNTVCATYASDLDVAIRAYVKGTGASTWAEQIGIYQDALNKSIQDAFG